MREIKERRSNTPPSNRHAPGAGNIAPGREIRIVFARHERLDGLPPGCPPTMRETPPCGVRVDSAGDRKHAMSAVGVRKVNVSDFFGSTRAMPPPETSSAASRAAANTRWGAATCPHARPPRARRDGTRRTPDQSRCFSSKYG
ncbi:hypothetical protein [Burkholderia cepacia]|uniref:hypothetical protein n=1 Tax=Burkholderia cepacia TaxID=292 RepID=UPI000F5EF046|nr:hypothetical protein [Burkholderia cepacia]